MSILDRLEAIERMLEQMVVRGTIDQVDCNSQRVKVRYGEDSVTDWIEWKPSRSGHVTIWSPPQVGEGVTVISDGDVNRGEVFLGSYHNSMPPPSTDPDATVMKFPDGTVFTYNMKENKLTLEVAGDATLDVKGNINAKAEGDIVAEAGGDARVKASGSATVEAGGQAMVKGASVVLAGPSGVSMDGGGSGKIGASSSGIQLGGGGSGVVTGAHVCAYTGKPHAACSGTVFAAG
ncbi:baseplate assembly protein V [Aeromonas phage 3]|nr:baseplate assembly protein V [Aeromonas phage 3]